MSTETTTNGAHTNGVTQSFKESAVGFRQHLPDLSIPRFQIAKDQDAYEYAEAFEESKHPPWIYGLTRAWQKLYQEPYKGLTSDGVIKEGIFKDEDQGVPIGKIANAAENVLSQLSPEQRKKVSYPLNAHEWRAWSNPEFLLRPFGLRLEDLSQSLRDAILAVLEASFSPEGYQKALGSMRTNHFLGEVCNVPKVMNVYSYNFLIFGTPSTTEPWGFNFYGHHLCINVFLKGPQIVVSPTFTGAEPNVIDDGPWKGTQILNVEGDLGLKLMQSLSDEEKHTARIYKLMKDPAMKRTGDLITDRWNQDDQRHVCGAFRDNRVVPYEGILVSSLNQGQKDLVLDICNQACLYLPQQARKMRLKQVESWFHETYFCWIGGWGDNDPFYYRIQSPVIAFEFDHHSGVFLTNSEPAKFHTHTILRTPNAGDYGNALRKREDWVQ